jgi:hypothetical protein
MIAFTEFDAAAVLFAVAVAGILVRQVAGGESDPVPAECDNGHECWVQDDYDGCAVAMRNGRKRYYFRMLDFVRVEGPPFCPMCAAPVGPVKVR